MENGQYEKKKLHALLYKPDCEIAKHGKKMYFLSNF